MEGWLSLLRYLKSHHHHQAPGVSDATSTDTKATPPDMCPELSAFYLLPIAQHYGMRKVVNDCTALLVAVVPAK